MPGGKIEPGETVAGAAIRELYEETGLGVDGLLYLMELETVSTRHHVYEASVVNLAEARPLNEIFDCIWHPLDAVHNLNTSDATLSPASGAKQRCTPAPPHSA